MMNRSWDFFVSCFFALGVLTSIQTALEGGAPSFEDDYFDSEEGNHPQPASGLGSGLRVLNSDLEQNISNISNESQPVFIDVAELPVCADGELLTFNGSAFNCSMIPERKCICPSPMVGSGEPPTLPPEPPGGCTVFEPPEGGGFVCLSTPAMIYCSVYCDNTHEFSTTPLNPYSCGNTTKFEWEDLTGRTQYMLPECTGFRYSSRPLHRAEFYLPGPCQLVTTDQADVQRIRNAFCTLVSQFLLLRNENVCDRSDSTVFVQCPTTAVATTLSEERFDVNP